MNEITVHISGPCNSGKSAIAFKLAKILADAGIECDIHNEDMHPDAQRFRAEYNDTILKSIGEGKKSKVSITQTATFRPPEQW